MNNNQISILISSLLGGLSLILGLLSLWFAYCFSNQRFKNKYLKKIIQLYKLEIRNATNSLPEYFFKEFGNLFFAKEKESGVSYVQPHITISDKLIKSSKIKLLFKFNFKFNDDYFIKWVKTNIIPIGKNANGILFGPKKDDDYIWPYSKIDPLDNPFVTKQAFNLTASLVKKKSNIKKHKK